MVEELAYSIHLGTDRNKSAKAKEIAKTNPSGETSFSNNGIQNATQLSKVNKHNLRDYDNMKDKIYTIYGTNNLYKDVQQLYLQEFEQSRIAYNDRQNREDRKIQNYFKHISDSKLWDLACEIIIELGDMDFWNGKNDEYRFKMIDVYKEQIEDLTKIVPDFKIANGTIHFDEISPHIHIVGVPVSDDNKRGMKKQVAKSKIFTKESLSELQDKMRNCCIKSYNKYYEKSSMLKQKKKGRNQDINVKDMGDYRQIKKQLKEKEQKLAKANNQTKKLDTASNDINEILDTLKPTKLNKNNMLISSENVQIIKKYTESVKDTTKTIRNVNDLNMAIRDFEHSAFEVRQENSSLKYELELKDKEIGRLKSVISKKDKIIDKLQTEKESLKEQLQKLKGFWHKTIKYFQDKINYNKDKNFIEVAKDLFTNKIFDNHEYEIVTDRRKNVKTIDEIETMKGRKKNNMELK
ncbi:MAG: plasmid recombination protein [Clostridia bacterium]|nr:plasmid recombination protein [Clostridia bacterium]